MGFRNNRVVSAPGPSPPDIKQRHFETDHLLKDLHGRSFRGGVVTIGGQAVKFLLQLISTVVLARLLKPQDFGLIAMVTAIVVLIGMCRELGLSQATVQRSEVTHAQVSVLFWINAALGGSFALIVAGLAPAVAWFYHEPRLIGITLALSITFVLSGLTAQHYALLRRQMRFKIMAVIEAASMASGIAAGIVMAWRGFGYWSLVGMQIVTSAVNCLLVWITCDWRPGPFQRRVGVKSMLAFGGNLTGFTLLNYFTRNFDNILIGRMLGSTAIGIYSKAYGLLMIPMSQINAPMGGVVIPALSRLQQRPAEYATLYLRALGALSLVTVPLVVFSFFLAKEVVLVMLGSKWLPVARVFQLLAPAALVGAISFAPGWLCVSRGRTRTQLHYAMISAPVCVAAFVIGIKWGIEGVAVAFSVVFTVLFWAYIWYASKDSPVKFSEIVRSFLSAFVPSCFAGVAAWLCERALPTGLSPIIALSVCALVFAICYMLAVTVSKRNRLLVFGGISALRKSLHL